MRKCHILLAFVFLLMLPLSSMSGEGKTSIYLGAGLGSPMSPDNIKKQHNMGLNFIVGVGYQFNPTFQIMPRVAYNLFPLDEDYVLKELEQELDEDLSGVTLDGGTLKVLEFGTDGKIYLTPASGALKFKPFFSGGIGMAKISFSDVKLEYQGIGISVPVAGSETKLTFNFGAGFDAKISPTMAIFANANYYLVTTEGETFSYLPIRVGLKIGFAN